MSTRKIKNAKDLTDGSLIYFKGHAQATYMSDGSTVEDAIKASKKVDLTGYATEEFVNYKTNELQILLDEHYVTTNILNESLPNLDNYVTNTTFNQAISAVSNNVNNTANSLNQSIGDVGSIAYEAKEIAQEGLFLAQSVQGNISDMETKTNAAATYLPLTGGTVDGSILITRDLDLTGSKSPGNFSAPYIHAKIDLSTSNRLWINDYIITANSSDRSNGKVFSVVYSYEDGPHVGDLVTDTYLQSENYLTQTAADSRYYTQSQIDEKLGDINTILESIINS